LTSGYNNARNQLGGTLLFNHVSNLTTNRGAKANEGHNKLSTDTEHGANSAAAVVATQTSSMTSLA
jgi:hypothetical protein